MMRTLPRVASRAAALAVVLLGLAAAGPCRAAEPEFSGQIRPQWLSQQAGADGPFAQARAIAPEIAPAPASGPAIETELHAGWRGLAAIVTLRQQRDEHEGVRSQAFVNELYGATDAGGWQFSAGKRIVAWDVGYGFRPNDVVEQEARRTLLTVTPEGRPLAMAEHFDAATAWTLVLVNPTKPRSEHGAGEPALAARVYRRDGAVDWHGFARVGAHTGASLGAAAAWVASEAVELHASLRLIARADTLADPLAGSAALARSDPWQAASVHRTAQALVGGTWTNAAQLSLLAEAWWDGTALAAPQWRDWATRNAALAAIDRAHVPAAAVAGNLGWQTDAFGASANLRRANLFARLSWQHEKWQPAFDLLVTPEDGGRVATASLGWQGDRVRLDAGARFYGGPASAVLAQLPVRRVVYAAATWPF